MLIDVDSGQKLVWKMSKGLTQLFSSHQMQELHQVLQNLKIALQKGNNDYLWKKYQESFSVIAT